MDECDRFMGTGGSLFVAIVAFDGGAVIAMEELFSFGSALAESLVVWCFGTSALDGAGSHLLSDLEKCSEKEKYLFSKLTDRTCKCLSNDV